jgi:hypothetical protein
MTDEAAETSAPVDAPASEDARIEAALGMFADDADASEPEAAPLTAPGPEDAAAPEPEAAEEGDPLEALTAALLAKKAEREPPAPTSSEQLMQQLLEQRTEPKIPEGYVRMEDILQQLKGDSVGFLEQHGVDLKGHTKAAYQRILKPETAAVEAKLNGNINALKAQVEELKAALESRQPPQEIQAVVQAHQANERRSVEDAFVAEIRADDADGPFPLVAKALEAKDLGRDYIIKQSRRIIDDLKTRGVDPRVITNEEILVTLNKQFERELRAFGHAETGTKRTRQGATALTSELASSGTSRGVLSDDEREQQALILLQQAG